MSRATFVCKRCLYSTNAKANLRAHLSRAHPCNVDADKGGQDIENRILLLELGEAIPRSKDHRCPFCKKTYSSAPSLYRHKKTCKSKNSLPQPAETDEHNNDKSELMEIVQSAVKEALENIKTELKEIVGSTVREALQSSSQTQKKKTRTQQLRDCYKNNPKWVSKTPVIHILNDKGCAVHCFMSERKLLSDHITALMMNEPTDKTEVYYKMQDKHYFMCYDACEEDEYVIVIEPEGKEGVVESTLNIV